MNKKLIIYRLKGIHEYNQLLGAILKNKLIVRPDIQNKDENIYSNFYILRERDCNKTTYYGRLIRTKDNEYLLEVEPISHSLLE